MGDTAPAFFACHGGILLMVFAYLDPAAGGMIIQTLVAAAVAVPFIMRNQISRLVARIKGGNGSEESDPSDKRGA
jgi:hypothetical protein